MRIQNDTLCTVYLDDIKNGVCKIPQGVKRIGLSAFQFLHSKPGRCTSEMILAHLNTWLEEVEIPQGIKSIESNAFFGCLNLKQVVLPSGLEFIGPLAFRACESLRMVSIPNTVKLIDVGAFKGCKTLTKIKIPNSIACVGFDAFDDCTSLKEITYKGKTRKVSCIDGWCMELVHSRKYDKYTIHKGYHFPDYETVYYVAECDGKYAHGKTAKEAIRDLEFKLCKDRGIEQYKGLTLNDKVNGYEFYRIMTGACHAGVKSYCDRTGTDINGEYTIQEVINKTKGEYGHDTLLSNLRKLGILEV